MNLSYKEKRSKKYNQGNAKETSFKRIYKNGIWKMFFNPFNSFNRLQSKIVKKSRKRYNMSNYKSIKEKK